MAEFDVELIEREILKGLPGEKERLHESAENMLYYNGEWDRARYREDAKDSRNDQETYFMRRVVDILTANLYRRSPKVDIPGNDAATNLLNKVYRKNNRTALWRQADRLSAINSVAAFQAFHDDDCVKLCLWGGDEFIVYADEDNFLEVNAVVTREMVNGDHIKYTLWTDAEIRRYVTASRTISPTANQSVPARILSIEPNPYGVIPFSFVFFSYPTSHFWVPALGTHLRRVNDHLNRRLTFQADRARNLLNPPLIGTNISEEQRFQHLKPGEVLHLAPRNQTIDKTPPEPKLENLKYDTAWVDADIKLIEFYINNTLEMLGVPPSTIRLEQSASKSGVALVAEQIPLLLWAEGRREDFQYYEDSLARLILFVENAVRPNQAYQKALDSENIQITWGSLYPDLPGPDRDQRTQFELENGLTSRIQIIMERDGLDRERAIEKYTQIQEDARLEAEIQASKGNTDVLDRGAKEGASPSETDDEGPSSGEIRAVRTEDATGQEIPSVPNDGQAID